MHYSELISIVKERRKTLGITQEQLSDLSGVATRTIKAFEAGKGNPTLETLQKMADILGLEVKLEIKKIS